MTKREEFYAEQLKAASNLNPTILDRTNLRCSATLAKFECGDEYEVEVITKLLKSTLKSMKDRSGE